MLKSRFKILRSASRYNAAISAALFNALCCLHNIIASNSIPIDNRGFLLSQEKRRVQVERAQLLPIGLSTRELKKQGEELRDKIAGEMWKDYQTIMRSRRFPQLEDA